MQPSEQTDPMGAPRRVPTAKDFPKTGPFSLAAPGPRFGARALDLSVVALPVLIVIAITGCFRLHWPSPLSMNSFSFC